VIILIGLIGFFTDQILALLRGVIFPYTDEGSAASANPLIKALLFLPRWFKDAAEQRLPHIPDKSTNPTRA
jgi:hypothetical protein